MARNACQITFPVWPDVALAGTLAVNIQLAPTQLDAVQAMRGVASVAESLMYTARNELGL